LGNNILTGRQAPIFLKKRVHTSPVFLDENIP